MTKRKNRYSVFVGGMEVNHYYLTKSQAWSVAKDWADKGYDDVVIRKHRVPSRVALLGWSFSAIYVATLLSMFHTLYITPEGQPPVYDTWQIIGLLFGLAGIALVVYAWDNSPK